MLTHDAMLRIARRHDTLMAHAMMRALGYEGLAHRRRHKRKADARREVERAKYKGMRWCFRNHGSPMDRKR